MPYPSVLTEMPRMITRICMIRIEVQRELNLLQNFHLLQRSKEGSLIWSMGINHKMIEIKLNPDKQLQTLITLELKFQILLLLWIKLVNQELFRMFYHQEQRQIHLLNRYQQQHQLTCLDKIYKQHQVGLLLELWNFLHHIQ